MRARRASRAPGCQPGVRWGGAFRRRKNKTWSKLPMPKSCPNTAMPPHRILHRMDDWYEKGPLSKLSGTSRVARSRDQTSTHAISSRCHLSNHSQAFFRNIAWEQGKTRHCYNGMPLRFCESTGLTRLTSPPLTHMKSIRQWSRHFCSGACWKNGNSNKQRVAMLQEASYLSSLLIPITVADPLA